MALYQKIDRIGGGGFGEVWSCRRTADNTVIAVKYLMSTDPEDIKRFKREARILATLRHKNIVEIFDADLDSAPIWFAMRQYGASLADLVDALKHDHKAVHDIFLQVLDGMEYAHNHGVLHRDLKPGNVLVDPDGSVAITDFGLGRQIDSATTRVTMTGDRFGTLAYMAPEQFRDTKTADHRSDIFFTRSDIA